MNLILLRSISTSLLLLLFTAVQANQPTNVLGPKVSCEKRGIPIYNMSDDRLGCMTNYTRCCIIRLEFENGLVQWASELDNETVYFSALSSLGIDDNGNESFAVTPIK